MKWVPCCENRPSGESPSDGLGSRGQEFTELPPSRGTCRGGKTWQQDRWARAAAPQELRLKCHFEMPLLTQGLVNQKATFQNG